MLEVWFVLYDKKLVSNIWRLPLWFRNRKCSKPLKMWKKNLQKCFDRCVNTTEFKVHLQFKLLHRRLSFKHKDFKWIIHIWNLGMDEWIMNTWMSKWVITFSVSLNPLKWIMNTNGNAVWRLKFTYKETQNVYFNCI